MSQFTDQIIGNVKGKEVGEIVDTLQSLVTSLNSAILKNLLMITDLKFSVYSKKLKTLYLK